MSGFANARIESERTARDDMQKRHIEEVTLDQIYSYMPAIFQGMKQKEISLEKAVCKANPVLLEIYRSILKQGKKIYICSDMYLPEKVIIYSGHGFGGSFVSGSAAKHVGR